MHLPELSCMAHWLDFWHRCADLQALNIRDSDAYYAQSSSFQYIPKIRTPCLFTLALNDPFIKYAATCFLPFKTFLNESHA